MRDGHIVSVEELPGLSDEEATARAHLLVSQRQGLFEGFELWDRERVIVLHLMVVQNHAAVWPSTSLDAADAIDTAASGSTPAPGRTQ